MAYMRLGDLLVSNGLITEAQLSQALEMQKQTGERLGTVLTKYGFIGERQLLEALEMQLGVEFVDLAAHPPAAELANVLSKNIAKKHQIVPVRMNKDELYIATSDPLNFIALGEVRSATRKRVVPMLSTGEQIDRAIATLYGNEGAARAIEEMKREAHRQTPDDAAFTASTLGEDAQAAPTVRLVNSIIERAASERASDIHLEPREAEMQVRMRIDGLLRSILTVPKNLQSSVVSRLKVMSGMDIAERKVPQDGRAAVRIKGRDVDLRMSTLPTIYGEKVVIRLLDKSQGLLDKAAIGLAGGNLKKFDRLLGNTSGVVLIVGPTGSGKSSTMYTMIRQLNTEQVNLVTLEDPVEYNLDGVNQVQINEKTGMTFAGGLRSILRQDPDIIAVGEIRDGETAEIAMRAAITGHLVLSTIHTSDAVSSIDRLLDIGVAPYLIAGAVRGIISQRLVRRVCPHCKKAYDPADEELAWLGMERTPGQQFYKGEGCPLCFHTGYRGRIAVFEILLVDRALREQIIDRAPRDKLLDTIRKGDFVSLQQSCRDLVIQGVTTAEESWRTIQSSEE
ncbi:MAG: GspE/PulE family protein [Eubacteriales bacterium]|nr:GspE/PulE family protein [Eubacteriales bacterium]